MLPYGPTGVNSHSLENILMASIFPSALQQDPHSSQLLLHCKKEHIWMLGLLMHLDEQISKDSYFLVDTSLLQMGEKKSLKIIDSIRAGVKHIGHINEIIVINE